MSLWCQDFKAYLNLEDRNPKLQGSFYVQHDLCLTVMCYDSSSTFIYKCCHKTLATVVFLYEGKLHCNLNIIPRRLFIRVNNYHSQAFLLLYKNLVHNVKT